MGIVLSYAELSEGKLKKPSFEAASYAADFAKANGHELHTVVVGPAEASELAQLGNYGVKKVHHITGAGLETFVDQAYAAAIAKAVEASGAVALVFPQSYAGRYAAPRLSVKLGWALLSGVKTLATKTGDGWVAKRLAFTGKAIQEIAAKTDNLIVTVKANAYPVNETGGTAEVATLAFEAPASKLKVKEFRKNSGDISLTEADVVVSAGRGLKGPENWGMIEELAQLLGAATASSKPVADVGWRPHHEHVGQTGIQIAPSVYIAVGISGAIQHLAGINQSKTIIVVNKDPEAPFFKAADYGVVADAFDYVPKLLDAVKAFKG